MKTCSLEKCTWRVAPTPATLTAVVSPPNTALRKGEKPFRSVASGEETTAHRVGSSDLFTHFTVIFAFPRFVRRFKSLDKHMAMSFATRSTTAIRSVISFGCSVGFSAGE